MRKIIGIICVILGVVCLLSSVGFILYNRLESQNAANFSENLLKDVQNVIANQNIVQDDLQTEMPTIMVEDYECIGILYVPALDIELPVLTEWNYTKLKKAPCHYYGSYSDGNFVIAAHNYKTHFGRLSQLKSGDVIMFADVRGGVHNYEVVLLETLPHNATEEMITSGFDLSLYTCTSGGAGRVTVRCKSIKNSY